MNAAVVTAFDAPPRYTSFADPIAAEGERLVHVTAAGLHQIVKSLANGTHYGSTGELPFIPGVDGVGRLEDGTRVYFGVSRSPYGTFAERGLAASWMCLPLPEKLDDVTAAGMANPGMSSWAALMARAKFVAGESVLILGATGVAGQLAVQIAKRLGARRVIAAGRNPEALEKLKELGADAVISLEQEHEALVAAFRRAWAEDGVDIVLDYLWGQPAECLLEAIAQKGLQHTASRVRFVQIGSSAGRTISLPGATLRSSGLELLGSGFGSASLDQLREAIAALFKAAATKPFQMHIKSAPLRDVEALWNSPEQGTRLVFQP
ncbi:MAG TPA: zinc-binding alcohol dehydrogenase family protein [Acidobacteriaceae bacterium]|jgi:NADPH2:quinone reductase|nr:zinc-binding alcohol dehydrogenase family protein [Acidobacteriaceae bacterium]